MSRTPAIGIPEVTRYGIPLVGSGLASDAELHVWTSAGWNGSTPNPYTSIDYTSGEDEFASTAVGGGALEDGTGFYWDVSLSEVGLSVTDDLDYPMAKTMTGDVDLAVVDVDGNVVESAIALIASDGSLTSSLDVSGLEPGEYQLTASGAYATVSDTETVTITVE